jgi:hypothetical protein
LFGRTEKNPTPATQVKEGGKGHPTPSRKEAEAAARERAKAVLDKKAASKQLRQRRVEGNRKMRAGMRAGDEKYLPTRDQGPVKRFIRDWIDARLCFAEFLLPLLVAIMVMSYSGNDALRSFGNGLWTATILLMIIDTMWTNFRLKKALRAKFPDESLKGTAFYAVLRVLQMRFMRMPKPNVKLGGKPK